MKESTYQAWLNKDREWIGDYCSRTRKSSLTKVVPLTLLLTALVLGGMGLLNGGGVPGLVTGVIGGLVFGLVVCGIYLAILMPSLTPARYTRKLEQSVQELSMDETEREQLGKEMLAALESGKGVVSYQMVGPKSKETPARVILTPHYILQEGSTPYAVLIRLSDIAEIGRAHV